MLPRAKGGAFDLCEDALWRLADDDYPKTLFLEHNPSFDRPGIYGDSGGDYPDTHRRFALFASAAIEIALANDGKQRHSLRVDESG